jgi:hypothetical protein
MQNRLPCFLSALCALSVWESPAFAATNCDLDSPIVLSHHFGARKICPDTADREDCDDFEPAKYCADWDWDWNEFDYDCARWEVPVAERDLPPRDSNRYDTSLTRDLKAYHRYFSIDVVERLEACGNAVFVADKPVFATYEARARSLRNTVLEALNETPGASRVILIGMSQGAQDARFLAAALPVDDSDADPDDPVHGHGWMRDKVAAVVTVVGEDRGTESASILLDAIWYWQETLDGTNPWGTIQGSILGIPSRSPAFTTDMALEAPNVFWKKQTAGGPVRVLLEGYDVNDGTEYNLDAQDYYDHLLRATANLSVKYMTGTEFADWDDYTTSWSALTSTLGIDSAWSTQVSDADEAQNGIKYFSYAAKIRNWYAGWTTAELATHAAIEAALDEPEWYGGDNDSYVSVFSSGFEWRAGIVNGSQQPVFPNFEHVKTLAGSALGRGYHHQFFTGRNDALYQPQSGYREAAPYHGSSADFYEVVARNLKTEGL